MVSGEVSKQETFGVKPTTKKDMKLDGRFMPFLLSFSDDGQSVSKR